MNNLIAVEQKYIADGCFSVGHLADENRVAQLQELSRKQHRLASSTEEFHRDRPGEDGWGHMGAAWHP